MVKALVLIMKLMLPDFHLLLLVSTPSRLIGAQWNKDIIGVISRDRLIIRANDKTCFQLSSSVFSLCPTVNKIPVFLNTTL